MMHFNIIKKGSSGKFIREPFTISTSTASSLYPFISYGDAERENVANLSGSITRFYTYSKPKLPYNDRVYAHSMSDIMMILREYRNVVKISLRDFLNDTVIDDEAKEIVVYIGKGYIADSKGKMLMCLCTNEPYYDDFFEPSQYDTEEYNILAFSQFTLLVSSNFARNPLYAGLYKVLDEKYINKLGESDVEIRHISSAKIEKLCYSNDYEFKFNSITSLLEYQDILRRLITNRGRVNFGEMDLSLVQEPLPLTYEIGDVLFGVEQTVSIHEYRQSWRDYWYNVENPPPPLRVSRHRQYRLVDDTEPISTVQDIMDALDNTGTLPHDADLPGTDGTPFEITMDNGSTITWNSHEQVIGVPTYINEFGETLPVPPVPSNIDGSIGNWEDVGPPPRLDSNVVRHPDGTITVDGTIVGSHFVGSDGDIERSVIQSSNISMDSLQELEDNTLLRFVEGSDLSTRIEHINALQQSMYEVVGIPTSHFGSDSDVSFGSLTDSQLGINQEEDEEEREAPYGDEDEGEDDQDFW